MDPRLARDWALNDPDAVAEVAALLAQAGFDGETIAAQTFFSKLESIDRVDRMIAQQEARRVALLREIDRRRAVLAERLRAAAATTPPSCMPCPTTPRSHPASKACGRG